MYTIGVDLGGTSTKIGITDENFDIVHRTDFATDARGGSEKIARDIANICLEFSKSCGISKDDISAVGIGVPGTVSKSGTVMMAPNIFMKNFDISAAVSSSLGKPAFALNDANSAALAEARKGAGKAYQSIVLITFGTGVGMGVVIGGRLWTGAHGCAGEVGHITVELNGIKCNCGLNGCFERYASATALINQARRAAEEDAGSVLAKSLPDDITGEVVFGAAKKGDVTALKVVDGFTSYAAAGLSSVINVLDPDAVIIGGGLSHAGDFFINPLAQKTAARCKNLFCGTDTPKIVKAQLGNDAGIIGAALYASDKISK